MTRDYQALFDCVSEQWFLAEPLLFDVLCTHRIVENSSMLCPMRTGQMRIEYNPERLDHIEDSDIRQMLRTEVIRIMLMHPYQRLPLNPDRVAMVIASDITISEHGHTAYGMCTRENWALSDGELQLPAKGYFEEYYSLVKERLMGQRPYRQISDEETLGGDGEETVAGQSGLGDDNEPKGLQGAPPVTVKDDAGELWEPDDLARDRIHRAIHRALANKSHGTVSDDMIAEIRANKEIRLNVRRHLAMFRSSVLSVRRDLSRMRPSRRYGFAQMGVKHPYRTRLLVGIDTSGSVSDGSLSDFLGVVNHFFSIGIEQIDVVGFDCKLHLPVMSLRKARQGATFIGRGGTSFQPIVDYAEDNGYDGLIVLTDGEADAPDVKDAKKLLWVLTDRYAYEQSSLTPRIYIPQ